MTRAAITGVLLAGGQGRRMGHQDKGLLPLDGTPMARRVLERLAPQVDDLLISANRNAERYAELGAPWAAAVIPDRIPGFAGPLAGLQAALAQIHTPFAVTVPCDAPFLPMDLVARLQQALESQAADLAIARTFDQLHPVFCLCHRRLLPQLEAYLAGGGRRVQTWHATLRLAQVSFDDAAAAFRNLNTPADLDLAGGSR